MRLRVRGVGKTEQRQIARQVRIFERVFTFECHPSHRRSDALAGRVVVCKKNFILRKPEAAVSKDAQC
jgi:hypothetical protein